MQSESVVVGRVGKPHGLKGAFFVDAASDDMHAALKSAAVPLNALGDAELVPGNAALGDVNASLR